LLASLFSTKSYEVLEKGTKSKTLLQTFCSTQPLKNVGPNLMWGLLTPVKSGFLKVDLDQPFPKVEWIWINLFQRLSGFDPPFPKVDFPKVEWIWLHLFQRWV
jgi:hypothetical protein